MDALLRRTANAYRMSRYEELVEDLTDDRGLDLTNLLYPSA